MNSGPGDSDKCHHVSGVAKENVATQIWDDKDKKRAQPPVSQPPAAATDVSDEERLLAVVIDERRSTAAVSPTQPLPTSTKFLRII